MSDTFSLGEPDVMVAMEDSPGMAEPEGPFRIGLFGDWSGRTNRNLPGQHMEIANRRPVLIDRDNFDEVMARMQVELSLSVMDEGDSRLVIRFTELDDFHPDRLFERLALFDALRQTRRRLENPETFDEAAREMRSWHSDASTREVPDKDSRPDAVKFDSSNGASLLEHLLGDESDTEPPPPRLTDHDPELQAMLRDVVRPYLVSIDEAQQDEMVGSVDEATSRLMRSILHHPDFQALEAAWRAAYFLVSRLETGTELKLYLIDIAKEELAADLSSNSEIEASGIYELIVNQSVNTFGGEPWAALAGNYTFDATREDIFTLIKLSRIARLASAPLLAAAGSRMLGCESLARTPDPDDWQMEMDDEISKAWAKFRQLPEASYIGLALPGFLLRLPYGEKTEPTEEFDFEELVGEPEHQNYLWANPAFACVYLLAEAFTEYGWDLQPGVVQDINDLPLHVYEAGGESHIKPCAETLLTMRAAERILDAGLMPLLSFQGRDRIRLGRFQSIADPPTSLAGRWL